MLVVLPRLLAGVAGQVLCGGGDDEGGCAATPYILLNSPYNNSNRRRGCPAQFYRSWFLNRQFCQPASDEKDRMIFGRKSGIIVNRFTLDACIYGRDKLAPSNVYNMQPDTGKSRESVRRKAMDLQSLAGSRPPGRRR